MVMCAKTSAQSWRQDLGTHMECFRRAIEVIEVVVGGVVVIVVVICVVLRVLGGRRAALLLWLS